MHILHVFHGFPVGGSEVRTCQLINSLGDSYRHTVVSLSGDFTAQTLLTRTDNVAFLHPHGFLQRSFLSNVVESRRWLGRTRPDLMIAYSWGGFEWLVGNSLLKTCPDVFAIEGFGADEAGREKPHRRLMRRIVSRRCTALLACSLRLKDVALRSWRAPSDKVIYIPNGIDLTKYAPSPRASASSTVALGIVASLSPVKHHVLLLDAFRRLPADAAVLEIAGDGPERERLLSCVDEWNLSTRVRFVGHESNPSAFLRRLDVFCLSSKSEQMPIAVLEAMASALPVVSTDVGDVRQMVCRDNGRFVVPPDDVHAYAEALRGLAGNAELRADLGRQNRGRCEEEFGFSLMVQRHSDLYRRCAGGEPPGGALSRVS